MLEFEQLKLRLVANEEEVKDLKDAIGYNKLTREIEELELKASSEGFWDDPEKSQAILQKTGKLKNTVEIYDRIKSSYDDLLVLIEMGDEEGDLSLVDEIGETIEQLESDVASLRLQTLLTGEYDANNAILTFHAGAGGTEAMDWVQMLVRMYTRWSERHGFSVKILDFLDGDEAGLKSAVMLIEGQNAYGYLKSES
ncbi:MAG: PCRF domain-containing protein, partial [Clostridia bacterium]|nr:PCRF domain-containing protein [Clostridia bacterium]